MPNMSISARNAQLDALASKFNSGTLECRTGTQPASAEDAATGTLLATITLATTAFPAASGGVLTMNATASSGTVSGSGTITWGRFKESGGATICDVSIGLVGAECIATKVDVVTDDDVDISTYTHELPEA